MAKIELDVEEYKELVRSQILVEMVKNHIESGDYVTERSISKILNIGGEKECISE